MIITLLDTWNLSVEEHRVFSQALGHSDLSVTLSSYGVPTQEKQVRVMKGLRERLT